MRVVTGVLLALLAGCGGDDFASVGATSTAATSGSGGGDASSSGDAVGASASSASGGTGGAGLEGGGGSGGSCVDTDDDGFDTCQADCDDADPTSFPGNPEVCGDARDNDCQNGTDDTCQGLGTFVSGTLGADTNPGTQAEPVKTIAKGVANALAIGNGVDVYVDHGPYAEKVALAEGVGLFGGYDASAGWTRDPIANETVLLAIDSEGVVAGNTITRQTELDGFRIEGLDGSGTTASAAITLAGGTPTITNNRIHGGDVGDNPSYGILVLAPSNDALGALVAGNIIVGGTGTGQCAGIRLGATSSPAPAPGAIAEVLANAISGQICDSSAGIANDAGGAGTWIYDNDVVAGSATDGSSWGIVTSATADIDANRVNVDQAGVGICLLDEEDLPWCGGILSRSGTGSITNNVSFGTRGNRVAGLMSWETDVAAGALSVNGNYLDGGGQQPSDAFSISAAVVVRTSMGVGSAVGTFRNNILAGGGNKNRFGVYEDGGSVTGQHARPGALENNDFWFPKLPVSTIDVPYRDWDGYAGTKVTTIAAVNTLAGIGAAANFAADPLLGPGFHLAAGSPCIDAGTATEAPAADFEGDSRPMGAAIDVGPDEAQ